MMGAESFPREAKKGDDRMAREMLLAGVAPEELQPEQPAQPPRSPWQKWENFWYHYKWIVLGCLFVAAVIAVLAVQCARKDPPDYTLLLASERGYLDSELAPLKELLESCGEDVDGDGKVEVQIITCQLGENISREMQLANYQSLQAHLATGDVMLFAFEPAYYEWLMGVTDGKEHSFLSPLPVQGAGVNEDGCSWDWSSDSRITEDARFDDLPQKLYFGVRAAVGTAEKRGEEHDQGMALLTALITGQRQDAPQE